MASHAPQSNGPFRPGEVANEGPERTPFPHANALHEASGTMASGQGSWLGPESERRPASNRRSNPAVGPSRVARPVVGPGHPSQCGTAGDSHPSSLLPSQLWAPGRCRGKRAPAGDARQAQSSVQPRRSGRSYSLPTEVRRLAPRPPTMHDLRFDPNPLFSHVLVTRVPRMPGS